MKLHANRAGRGFSLLEVLIAVVVLSFGLLALATLQLSLFKSSAASKAQSVAVSLAKDQIESMRSFQTLDGYIALTDKAAVNTTVGGVVYAVSSTVDRYVYGVPATGTPGFVKQASDIDSEATLESSTDPKYILGRDFKRVQVKVTWSESTGDNRTLTLEDVIDGLDPADSAKVVKNSSNVLPRNVEVIITNPASEAGVIPIAIGDSKDTAATNPRPVVNSTATETRFDIYTYSALTDSTALAQSRVETNVVGCTCSTGAAPTDTDTRGYRPTYWNGTRYVPPTLTTYAPPAGQDSTAAANESPYCTICCRDHNDPAGTTTAKFDPYRASHDHYYYDDTNKKLVIADASHSYKEACRLIRVDGIYRVAADFNNEYFNLLETNKESGNTAGVEYAPSDSTDNDAVTNYQNTVLAYLDAKVVNQSDSSKYNDVLSTAEFKFALPPATTDGDAAASTDVTAETDPVGQLETDNGINDPDRVTFKVNTDYTWLHSRGLYIDHLEPEALAAIAKAKQDCVTNSCTAEEKQSAILQLMPFTSINLSELSIWTPIVSANKAISITGGSFLSAASSTDPVRGRVAINSAPTTDTDVDAEARILASNSGLAIMTRAINPYERGKLDDQHFTVKANLLKGGKFTVIVNGLDESSATSGKFKLSASAVGATIGNCNGDSNSDGVPDSGFSKSGGKQVGRFVCSMDATSATLLQLSASWYNYQSAKTIDLNGKTIDCYNGTTKSSYTVPNGSVKPQAYTCPNFAMTATSATLIGSPLPSDGVLSEATTATFATVTDGDTFTLQFSGPDTSKLGYTCTYTGASPTATTVSLGPQVCPTN